MHKKANERTSMKLLQKAKRTILELRGIVKHACRTKMCPHGPGDKSLCVDTSDDMSLSLCRHCQIADGGVFDHVMELTIKAERLLRIGARLERDRHYIDACIELEKRTHEIRDDWYYNGDPVEEFVKKMSINRH